MATNLLIILGVYLYLLKRLLINLGVYLYWLKSRESCSDVDFLQLGLGRRRTVLLEVFYGTVTISL